MDNKVNHFLVKVSDGVPLDNVVAAAKTNKDKIFFTPTGQIVVAGIGTDTDGKAKVIQYGVDNTEYAKIYAKLKDFIDGSIEETVKNYVDSTADTAKNNAVNEANANFTTGLTVAFNNSDFATYQSNGDLKNKLSIKYVPATADKAAHIALVAKDGTTELSSINVSDIVGNGVLSSSGYDSATGILTLQFKNGSNNGTTPVTINLKELLDVDDIVVSDDSKDYLTTTTATPATDKNQLTIGLKQTAKTAIDSAKTALHYVNFTLDDSAKDYAILDPAEIQSKFDYNHGISQSIGLNVASNLATVTDADKKLADAAAVKKYTDDAVANKNVQAGGDTYVNASADANTVTVAATESTKKSLGLANTSIQEIKTEYSDITDGSTSVLALSGISTDKDSGGKSVTLNLDLKQGVVKTTDDFAATPGFATASNIHDFVMAYVAHALDNYNPWETYTGE